MGFLPISQCIKDWDFHPLNDLDPVFPPVAWRGHIIAGFSSKSDYALSFDDHDFISVFCACYRELTLAETARFFILIKDSELFESMNWEGLVESFHWKWNDQLKKTFYSLAQTPMSFQNWSSRRKFGIQDWALLNALPSIPRISALLQQIADSSLSYQNGRQIMELGIELFLNGCELEALLKMEAETENSWLQRLYNRRYPISTKKDQAAKEKLKKLPVPPHVRVEWRRNGDLSGLKVEFFAHSPDELRKKIEKLSGFERILNDHTNSPWTEGAVN